MFGCNNTMSVDAGYPGKNKAVVRYFVTQLRCYLLLAMSSGALGVFFDDDIPYSTSVETVSTTVQNGYGITKSAITLYPSASVVSVHKDVLDDVEDLPTYHDSPNGATTPHYTPVYATHQPLHLTHVVSEGDYVHAPAYETYAHSPVYNYDIGNLGYGSGKYEYGQGLSSYGLNYGYGLGDFKSYYNTLRRRKKCMYSFVGLRCCGYSGAL